MNTEVAKPRNISWVVVTRIGRELFITQTSAMSAAQATEYAYQEYKEKGFVTSDAYILYVGKGRIGENIVGSLVYEF